MGGPCIHTTTSRASCFPLFFPQVMNMYGDLVMDTVPEKVGPTGFFFLFFLIQGFFV